MIPTPLPVMRMSDLSCTHHIQVDILQAPPKVLTRVHHHSMIPVPPEGTRSRLLTQVVRLCEIAFQRLHETADVGLAVLSNQQQVRVIRRNTSSPAEKRDAAPNALAASVGTRCDLHHALAEKIDHGSDA